MASMNKVRCWGDILLLSWMVLDGLLVVWSAFLLVFLRAATQEPGKTQSS